MRALSPPCQFLASQIPWEGSGQGVPSTKTLLQGWQSLAGYHLGSPTHHGPLVHLWGRAGRFFYHISQQSFYLRAQNTSCWKVPPSPSKGLTQTFQLASKRKNQLINLCKNQHSDCTSDLVTGAFLCLSKFSLKPLVQKLIYPKCQQSLSSVQRWLFILPSPWVSQMLTRPFSAMTLTAQLWNGKPPCAQALREAARLLWKARATAAAGVGRAASNSTSPQTTPANDFIVAS